mmetsp:Transcript_27278/g.64075  ORF Transcript_27278/g.64075 Transcript_27278/m.64075 type:complete len:388 (+) Transcript_27278:56-1219(+)
MANQLPPAMILFFLVVSGSAFRPDRRQAWPDDTKAPQWGQLVDAVKANKANKAESEPSQPKISQSKPSKPKFSNKQLEKAELNNINRVSFVPTRTEIEELVGQSIAAEAEREEGNPGLLLSKLYKIKALCPDSLNPDDTILAKLGRGSSRGGIGAGGNIGDPGMLTFLNDTKMPLGAASNGPNAVLTNCTSGIYGTKERPRINLFYENEEKVQALLVDFISLRTANEASLFKMYVAKLQEFTHGGKNAFKLDPAKDELLAEELQDDYAKTVSMFTKIASALGDHGSIEDYGLKVNSYCQTWLRNGGGKGGEVGNAQFSVMSPHFQTRFFVASAKKLAAAKVTKAEKEAYLNILQHFDEVMETAGYSGADGPAFVNLDGLLPRLSEGH